MLQSVQPALLRLFCPDCVRQVMLYSNTQREYRHVWHSCFYTDPVCGEHVSAWIQTPSHAGSLHMLHLQKGQDHALTMRCRRWIWVSAL